MDYDFAASGHSLCIVDTGGNHSDLTDDYAAIRSEMEAVAHAMGKSVLRQVAYEDFFAALPELQTKVNDRALIRAIHFYNDNHRVEDAVSCLEQGNFDGFWQTSMPPAAPPLCIIKMCLPPRTPRISG